ncbi:hypothetical protein HYX12_03790, partial [Candidatus Woesearchaeota archaeon]|nr:hypothetical protein [Candidatus Woesearchaeota archaeon]
SKAVERYAGVHGLEGYTSGMYKGEVSIVIDVANGTINPEKRLPDTIHGVQIYYKIKP